MPSARVASSFGSSAAGPYDALYRAVDVLWPSRPGRMVRRASEIATPGRALDVGCGDGKNLYFLERNGWRVDGVDVSEAACRAAELRLRRKNWVQRGWLRCQDAVATEWCRSHYDLVVCYGVLHCLRDDEARTVFDAAFSALVPGGLLAIAAFNDELPVPEGHGTSQLYLRRRDYVLQAAGAYDQLDVAFGTITESHEPLIGEHRHSLTWALLRKPCRR
jgi:SAM-dependent methyltransferase